MAWRELWGRFSRLITSVTFARNVLILVVIGLVVWHGVAPDKFTLDWYSLFLVALVAVLVLVPVLRSAKLPGGTSFEFRREVEAAEELSVQVQRRARNEGKLLEGPRLGQPGIFNLSSRLRQLAVDDPSAALAMLRQEVIRAVAAAVRVLAGGWGFPREWDEMLRFLADKSTMWPEQLALLKVVDDLANKTLLSGHVTPAEALRVIAVADTLNSSFPIGYSLNFEPNADWQAQRRVCQYEHCIENMKLPEIPRSEQEAWRAGVRERLDGGFYDEKPDTKASLMAQLQVPIPANTPETVDRTGACPLFGHFCPGGVAIVETCEVAKAWVEGADLEAGPSS